MTGRVTARQAPPPPAHPARSSPVLVGSLDRAVASVLRVQPQAIEPREAGATTTGRPFETPLLLAALRCALRYVVLPFMIPFVVVATGATRGIVTGAALGLLLILDVLAVIGIVATLRRLWRLRHPRRWQYLPVALTLAILVGIFLASDARVLAASWMKPPS